MDTYDEMRHNAASLKRCRRIYNTVSLIYASICLVYAAASLFMIILTVSDDVLFLFFDGIIFKILLFVCGYLGCYKHQNKFTVYAIITSAINSFAAPIIFNQVIFVACIITSALTIIANHKYKFLSQQLGFPYFNQRYEEYKLDATQNNIKSTFQQNYERRQKNSSDSMGDFIDANISQDNGENDKPSSYEMEDII